MTYSDDGYMETQVTTAPPERLHLIVIDGAIRFATRARAALAAGDIEAAHVSLNRARDFVAELISGVDPGHSPELAGELQRLFAFVYRRLAEADLHRDAGRIDDALRILNQHRETWLELIETLREAGGETEAAASGLDSSV
ncbi:MAG: flagellar export chaperone FliS [Planctomycetes bacterium]|nr:flagellar export chaperone FliS [Planctomycetota bacterium]